MKEISYEHALDPNGRLITTDVGQRGGNYTCPNCRQRLIFRAGEIRQRHFAHKGNACDPETYLHQAAKLALGQELERRTDAQQGFNILAYGTLQHIESGTERVVSTEYTQSLHPYNVLSGQPSIAIEERHAGFVPDILVKGQSQTYFIEIFVTHPVSEEKIASGIPIIQVKIESESDIETLVKGNLPEGIQTQLFNFDSFRSSESFQIPPRPEPDKSPQKNSNIWPAEQPLLNLEGTHSSVNPKAPITRNTRSDFMPIRFRGQTFPSKVRHLYYRGDNEILDLSRTPGVIVEGQAQVAGRNGAFRFRETIEEIFEKTKAGKYIVIFIDKVP